MDNGFIYHGDGETVTTTDGDRITALEAECARLRAVAETAVAIGEALHSVSYKGVLSNADADKLRAYRKSLASARQALRESLDEVQP